jgi:hypothetical protein
MKKVLLILLLSHSIAIAQPKQNLYDAFLKYVSSNIRVDTFKRSCLWQYALVKIDCNTNNKVVKYTLLNGGSLNAENSLSFLNNYQFSKAITINQRPIIFCITFENHSTDCILKDKTIAVEGIKEVYTLISQQLKKNPKSIFLNDILSISYNYDAEP